MWVIIHEALSFLGERERVCVLSDFWGIAGDTNQGMIGIQRLMDFVRFLP